MSKVRVLLVDDHAVVRAGIRNAIEELPNLEIVGEADDGPSLMAALEELQPECLLIDVTMPDFEPVVAIRQIRIQYPNMRILVVSAYDDDVYVQGLLRAGVDGYHLKDQPLSDLRLAIERVISGEKWISGPLVDKLVSYSETTSLSSQLTTRQREMLSLLQQGLDNQTIAVKLELSIKTIENHLTRLYRLLGVQSRLEAVNYVIQHPQILALSGQEAAQFSVPGTPNQEGVSIMLVDDNPRYRHQLCRMIGKICPQVTIYEAENISEAVQLAKHSEFQLILIDVILGEQNGIHCASRIKAISPKSRIILISAYPDREFHRLGLEAGAIAFLDKKELDSATIREMVEDVAASPPASIIQ
jgi:DNA-binding NarL/FixJ family response regulator